MGYRQEEDKKQESQDGPSLLQGRRVQGDHDGGEFDGQGKGHREKRVLRRRDALRRCGVRGGSTVQVTSRMRGGGRHKEEKKQVPSLKRTERTQKQKAEFELDLNARRPASQMKRAEETDDDRWYNWMTGCVR